MIRRLLDAISSKTPFPRTAGLAVIVGAVGGTFAMSVPVDSSVAERGLLWRVVQTCIVNHLLTGASFPCLDVQMPNGRDTGWATLRAPLEKTHIIVTPTVRTIGIEARRLQAADAPSYFHDAWDARHFVTDELHRKPDRADLGMAVNSRTGRSQDQLHIHVNCLRGDVKRSLAQRAQDMRDPLARTTTWTRLAITPHAPRYFTLDVASADLTGVNIFALVANGLAIDPDDMDDMTIVVAGADAVAQKAGRTGPGFTILARKRQAGGFDDAHGEALLDHECKAFQ